MPTQLLTPELLRNALAEQFQSAKSGLLLSAYVSDMAADFILTKAHNPSEFRLYLRGSLHDFLSGASSIDAVKALVDTGIQTFIKPDLHAKLFIFNRSIAYIGSANLTGNGLHLSSRGGNYELSTQLMLSHEEITTLDDDLSDAIEVTPTLLPLLMEYLKSIDYKETPLFEPAQSWQMMLSNAKSAQASHQYHESLKDQNRKSSLSLTDLPQCHLDQDNPESALKHDRAYFGLGFPPALQKSLFEASRIYQFLLTQINTCDSGEVYFGEVAKKIHDALDEPITRQALKPYIQNIYSYFDHIETTELNVDRPNYSQRIYLRAAK